MTTTCWSRRAQTRCVVHFCSFYCCSCSRITLQAIDSLPSLTLLTRTSKFGVWTLEIATSLSLHTPTVLWQSGFCLEPTTFSPAAKMVCLAGCAVQSATLTAVGVTTGVAVVIVLACCCLQHACDSAFSFFTPIVIIASSNRPCCHIALQAW